MKTTYVREDSYRKNGEITCKKNQIKTKGKQKKKTANKQASKQEYNN